MAAAAARGRGRVLALLLMGLLPAWGITGAAWARVGGALGGLVVVLPWLARIAGRSPSTGR